MWSPEVVAVWGWGGGIIGYLIGAGIIGVIILVILDLMGSKLSLRALLKRISNRLTRNRNIN